jgi:hypothetical protein
MTFASSVPAASRIATFNDPDLYRQAVRAVDADVVVVGSGDFRGELTKVDFERLWIQRGHETLPRIAWLKHNPARAPIFFLTRAGQGSMSDSGRDVSPGDIVFHSLGATYHSRTGGETHWGAMSLTPDDLAAVGRAVVGRELTVPSVTSHWRADPALMSRLVDLHDSAGQLARKWPDIFAHPEVARALEQMLLHAMVRCLADGAPVETSREAAAMPRPWRGWKTSWSRIAIDPSIWRRSARRSVSPSGRFGCAARSIWAWAPSTISGCDA